MSEGKSGSGFSPDEQRALSGVLDEIIPPSGDGTLPGAGELGLVRHIEGAAQAAPDLRPALVEGLSAVDALARGRGSQGFAALSRDDRREVLSEVAATQSGFLPFLIFHTYAGYYQHPRVLEALGLEPRPPHPKGYEIEPFDLTLLDRVRGRPKLYRDC